MKHIFVITNPKSRKNAKNPEIHKKINLISNIEAEKVQSENELSKLLQYLHAHPPQILAINGGDGTLTKVINTWLKNNPPPLPTLLPLCGGTMNVVAAHMNIKGNPIDLLKRALKAIKDENKHHKTLNLLKIDNIYGFVFGVGCFAKFVEEYDTRGKTGSPLRAAQLLLKASCQAIKGSGSLFPNMEDTKIKADNSVINTQNTVGAAVSVVKHAGLGFKPFYLAENGQMHAIILKRPLPPLALALPAALSGKAWSTKSSLHLTCNTLEITLPAPEKFLLDGDIHLAGSNKIKVEKGLKISFLIP